MANERPKAPKRQKRREVLLAFGNGPLRRFSSALLRRCPFSPFFGLFLKTLGIVSGAAPSSAGSDGTCSRTPALNSRPKPRPKQEAVAVTDANWTTSKKRTLVKITSAKTEPLEGCVENCFFYEKGCHTNLLHEKGCCANLFHYPSICWEVGIITSSIRLLFTIGTSQLQIGSTCIYFRTSHTTRSLIGMVDYAVDSVNSHKSYIATAVGCSV